MLNRHLSRSIVLQTLFEWDVQGRDKIKIFDILNYNLKEFASLSEAGTNSFAESLIKGVLKEEGNLNDIIQQAAPQWPINRISAIDRNILRVGIYELLFSNKDEVPPKVAINEAIELAKAFGGESSGKFVSGVLGTIYKELGEPRKHETTENNPHKKKRESERQKNLPVQELGGAVVYAEKNDQIFLAFVHNIFGYWTLIKGKKEGGESIEECVAKEAKRGIGLDVIVGEELGVNEYIATLHVENDQEKRGAPTKKKVSYFLAKANFALLELGKGEDRKKTIDDARWFELSKIGEIEIYEDLRTIINKGIESIKSNVESRK